MAENKFYTRTKEIRGKEYTAQYAGLTVAMKLVDETYIDGSSNTSIEKLAKYVFDHGIVEPKGLTIDDFDDMEELNEVVTFGREVIQGKFRDKADNGAAKAAGRK